MIARIAWKNIWFKPLNTALSIILLTASVAIITLLILLQEQFEKQFDSNIDNIDLVLGAQGSPLQLILSAVYQIDAPTGNIDYTEAKTWMKHRFVQTAVPLAFGDNYKGFRIVGTTTDYLTIYGKGIKEGRPFAKNFEVVIGSSVATKMNVKIGDKFFGSHGDAAEGELHEDHAYIITGIAAPTGKVADNLILCNIPSVWAMHDEGAHEHAEEDEHSHEHEHQDEAVTEEGKEITAVLIKFRSKMGIVMWPRLIAQNTKMQAASPAIEINRLFSLFGIGLQALQYLAYGIMFISGISIFIALYNTLKERKYEFALLRVNGASRLQLLWLVLIESLLLCTTGFIFGTVVGRIALSLISGSSESEFKMSFNPLEFVWQKEGYLFGLTIFVGILAAVIPAVKAYSLNISKTLANA
ncbi:permease [Flavobacterium rivuli WB 3.3-2 = DSM 21788]|uniref:Permease n=1 Tax=Flavobacterium rivuli WB 3.3-2 = DSM 21788 TaxID=1121895 RepID=A0A0A2MIS8_9FLAO|nr:FtsX-like permease family protein [Flavobacterium rivuli]KGO88200.1 permease [Flavobacterium rivuli WB 3.3-2 = DSM 21788]